VRLPAKYLEKLQIPGTLDPVRKIAALPITVVSYFRPRLLERFCAFDMVLTTSRHAFCHLTCTIFLKMTPNIAGSQYDPTAPNFGTG